MPLSVSHVTRRDRADRGEFGVAALDLCRQYRGAEGVVSARYWWSAPSTIAFVIETEPGVLVQSINSSDIARATFAMDDLGNPHGFETWGDARGGADGWESAGRPSGA